MQHTWDRQRHDGWIERVLSLLAERFARVDPSPTLALTPLLAERSGEFSGEEKPGTAQGNGRQTYHRQASIAAMPAVCMSLR
jgi:hypothetical protein